MSDSAEYRVIYWPNMAGRGEYVRLMLAQAGVNWDETNDKEEVVKLTKGGELPGFPAYAPPVLVVKNGPVLSQTHAIQEYLGHKYDMIPESGDDRATASALNLTLHDFIMEGNLNYHMKDVHDDYLNQKEYTEPFIKDFIANRLRMFFKYFTRALEYNSAGEYLYGSKLTYPDITLYHVMCVVESDRFCDWPKIKEEFPALTKHWELVGSLPKIAAYKKVAKNALQGYSFM